MKKCYFKVTFIIGLFKTRRQRDNKRDDDNSTRLMTKLPFTAVGNFIRVNYKHNTDYFE